jgi:hypothetical protein
LVFRSIPNGLLSALQCRLLGIIRSTIAQLSQGFEDRCLDDRLGRQWVLWREDRCQLWRDRKKPGTNPAVAELKLDADILDGNQFTTAFRQIQLDAIGLKPGKTSSFLRQVGVTIHGPIVSVTSP